MTPIPLSSGRARFRAGALALLSGAALIAGVAVAPGASATAGRTETSYSGNKTCADFGYDQELKIDEQPTNRTYALGDPKVEAKNLTGDVQVTISNVELVDGRMEFDWSSNVQWAAVLVKQANGGLFYHYDVPVSADVDVRTVDGQNKGGISHVDFCRNRTDETTTTEEPTTTTEEPTTTSSVLGTVVDRPTTSSTVETTDPTVMGVQVVRDGQLPRTGVESLLAVYAAAGLIAVGLALMAQGRRRSAGGR